MEDRQNKNKNIFEITHLCIRHGVHKANSWYNNLYKRRVLTSVFFWAKFRQLTEQKKKPSATSTKDFFWKFSKISPYFLENYIKFARFRQWVHVARQDLCRIQKKLKHETNINKKKSKNTKTIKREWKQMKEGKGNTIK